MNTVYNLFDESPFDTHENPFAELRTVPWGWDSGAILQSTNHIPLTYSPAPGQAPAEAADTTHQFEKFPKPRTTPKGWDVSALR